MISQGRKAVEAAFRFDIAPGRSPTAHFSGQKRSMTIVGGRGGGKTAAHRVHAVATRIAGKSKPLLVDSQKLTGAVHRAVAELESLEFKWIQYRYRPPGMAREQHGETFRRAYYEAYDAKYLKSHKIGTRQMVRYLISVAMENESNPGISIRPDTKSYDRRNWNKTYRPHWDRISAEISNIDGHALYTVALTLAGGAE